MVIVIEDAIPESKEQKLRGQPIALFCLKPLISLRTLYFFVLFSHGPIARKASPPFLSFFSLSFSTPKVRRLQQGKVGVTRLLLLCSGGRTKTFPRSHTTTTDVERRRLFFSSSSWTNEPYVTSAPFLTLSPVEIGGGEGKTKPRLGVKEGLLGSC